MNLLAYDCSVLHNCCLEIMRFAITHHDIEPQGILKKMHKKATQPFYELCGEKRSLLKNPHPRGFCKFIMHDSAFRVKPRRDGRGKGFSETVYPCFLLFIPLAFSQ